MSAGDGQIIGMTPLREVGPRSKLWNLVFLSDGYVAARMSQFAADAAAVVQALLAESPFSDPAIAGNINIFRIDVASSEAGADHPNCADGGGNGRKVKTWFDSTFCSDGRTQRLLYGNAALAASVASQFVPQWRQIMVLVDVNGLDADRGGAGGQIGWFSNGGSDWKDVAIHELGHSAFGLADEYDYGGPDRWTGGEPSEPNVSTVADPARVKWRSVNAGAAVPTRRNPDCTKVDPGPPGTAADVVGTFEGAKYSHCSVYRPTWNCKMRDTRARFCPVCVDRIRTVMAGFGAA